VGAPGGQVQGKTACASRCRSCRRCRRIEVDCPGRRRRYRWRDEPRLEPSAGRDVEGIIAAEGLGGVKGSIGPKDEAVANWRSLVPDEGRGPVARFIV